METLVLAIISALCSVLYLLRQSRRQHQRVKAVVDESAGSERAARREAGWHGNRLSQDKPKQAA